VFFFFENNKIFYNRLKNFTTKAGWKTTGLRIAIPGNTEVSFPRFFDESLTACFSFNNLKSSTFDFVDDFLLTILFVFCAIYCGFGIFYVFLLIMEPSSLVYFYFFLTIFFTFCI
jgi:hypothetical protein